tara:strand:+ start:576 stop:1211 length:636 start_codon:yes stop_codon:yes gene_type:complete
MKFYTFGIQRTCTNLARATVQANFWCDYGNVNDFGHWSWKHSSDAEQSTANLNEKTPVIFCYKKPISWVESLKKNDVDFINKNGLAKYENSTDPELIFKNSLCSWSLPKAIDKWISFHIDWIKYLHRCNYVIMRQDQMTHQPSVINVLSKIQYKLKLVKKIPNWTVIDRCVNHGGRVEENLYKDNAKTLSDKQIEYIENKIPKEIINFYEQ